MRQKMRETTIFGLYFYGLEPLFSRKILRFNIGQKLAALARKPSFLLRFLSEFSAEENFSRKKSEINVPRGTLFFPKIWRSADFFRGEFYKNSYALILPLFPEKINTFFIFQVDLIGTPHDVSFRRSFIRSFGFFFLIIRLT